MNSWTIIYLVRCEAPYILNLVSMVKSLLSRKLPQTVGIVMAVQMSRENVEMLERSVPVSFRKASDETTMFYRIGSNGVLERLGEQVDFDIYESDDLETYFQKVVQKFCPAEHYLLATWGHGAPTGIFKQGAILSGWKLLVMDVLRTAITNSFPDGIDVMLMTNCDMLYFDNLLQLKAAKVQYLVAAEDVMSFTGYNYDALLDALCCHPGIAPEDVARHAVVSIGQRTGISDAQSGSAIFAMDLSACGQLINLVDELGAALRREMMNNAATIQAALNDDAFFSLTYGAIDLFYLMQIIREELGGNWQSDLLSRLWELRADCIVAGFKGQDLIQAGDNRYNGITVCVPPAPGNAFYQKYLQFGCESPSSLATTYSNWITFLDMYNLEISAAVPA